jgi:hypothetical protein
VGTGREVSVYPGEWYVSLAIACWAVVLLWLAAIWVRRNW